MDSGKGFIEAYIDYWTMCGNSQQQACILLKDKGYVGALIKHLIEKRGMAYKEACEYMAVDPAIALQTDGSEKVKTSKRVDRGFQPRQPQYPPSLWQKRAQAFLEYTHKHIFAVPSAQTFLIERGLSDVTIKEARLGWNLKDIYRAREAWGLSSELNEKTGKPKKLWLPKGLIIPSQVSGHVIRLRVRRPEPDRFGRYIVIPGSDTKPFILGCTGKGKPQIIVESELDALLIHQEAGDLVGVIALGCAQIRPDVDTHKILTKAETILLSLDSDKAGATESWGFWARTYRQFKRWPCIEGKDPGEMAQAGVDIRSWVKAGLKDGAKGGTA